MRVFAFAAALMLVALPAAAENKALFALNVGKMIGTAEACEVELDQNKLGAFLVENGLDDMELAASFDSARSIASRGEKSPSSCTAALAAVVRAGLAAE